MNTDRLPPHCEASEKGALGCAIQDAACAADLRPELFYTVRHRETAQALIQAAGEAVPWTLQALQIRLAKEIEGITLADLLELTDEAPSPGNFSFFTDQLRDTLTRRKIIAGSVDVIEAAHEPRATADKVLEQFDALAAEVRPAVQHGESDRRAVLDTIYEELDEAVKNPGKAFGLTTGFNDLDCMTGGLKPGQLVVIAARPSVGKTSLAMAIAERTAVDAKIPVAVFSLEMTAKELLFRMVCSRARVDSRAAQVGEIKQPEIDRLARVRPQIQNSPLHVVDAAGLAIGSIRARAKRLQTQHGIRLVLVDYIGLVNGSAGKNENRTVEITRVSNGLKILAKELSVPVIALSQLNRENERDGRKPRLADLRDSGSIEQDADVCGLLHVTETNGEIDTVELNIAKQRNGPTGKFNLRFVRKFCRFENASKYAND